ncbi:MAG: hypothetical protein KIT36_18455 [Alphaproteobacteria bacterium]|nr:hypothetical protein [Alphaproteobacteria bacterium]
MADYFAPFAVDWNDGRWWWTAGVGVVDKKEDSEIARGQSDLGRTYRLSAGVGREVGALWNVMRLEWEVVGAVHVGSESLVDLRANLIARWTEFPWNHIVYSTFALGIGPSFITRRSRYESEGGQHSRHLTNGVLFELTLAPPRRPDWAFALRLDHRSPIFDLIRHGGTPSDFVVVGVKHRF